MIFYIDARDHVFFRSNGRPIRVRFNDADQPVFIIDDLVNMTGATVQQIRRAADSNSTISSAHCPTIFHLSWADEDYLRGLYPDAVFIHATPPGPSRPCTIHYQSVGRYAVSEDVYMRTMTAVRDHLRLTRRQFEAIAHRAPGYVSHLPAGVIGITVHPHGWTPPTIFFSPATDPAPLFHVHTLKSGVLRVRVAANNNLVVDYQTFRDIPDEIMSSCRFVP